LCGKPQNHLKKSPKELKRALARIGFKAAWDNEDGDGMCNLARDSDLGRVLVAERGAGAVGVVEDNGDGSLGDPGLALLVDELLERGGAHLAEICDAEHEADGVEDVGLAGAVKPGDGVEQRVEPRHHRPPCVRLEPLEGYLLDVHLAGRRRGVAGRWWG